jgi:TusA-related sulfurtransferase
MNSLKQNWTYTKEASLIPTINEALTDWFKLILESIEQDLVRRYKYKTEIYNTDEGGILEIKVTDRETILIELFMGSEGLNVIVRVTDEAPETTIIPLSRMLFGSSVKDRVYGFLQQVSKKHPFFI